jgi:L-iditol 2-dehydrogenase
MLHATSFDPGGFAEQTRLSAAHVERGTLLLPPHMSFEEGTFVEPLACAIRGQRLSGLVAGDRVAVLGSGISGLLHVQLARLAGADPILATDVSDYRLDHARRLGADDARRADEPLGERNADRVLVCTSARAAMESALRLVDDGGAVLIFAPLQPGESLALPVAELWKRGVSLVHSYGAAPRELGAALELIAAGRIEVASMVTHRLPLAQAQEGFRLVAAAGESLKVILEP